MGVEKGTSWRDYRAAFGSRHLVPLAIPKAVSILMPSRTCAAHIRCLYQCRPGRQSKRRAENSRQSNALEGELIAQALVARDHHLPDSIAIITPHRAQRALLRGRLAPYTAAASIIDTVERLQGGERPTIIVSGTESDPHAIGAAASFILNLNRANVAFSRTQERLIVVCAETLLDHVPVEIEDYESALLWKSLRSLCSRTLFDLDIDGHRVRALAPVLRSVG